MKKFLRTLVKHIHFVFTPIEKKILKKYSQKKSNKIPIFIIGIPRSGSTILYQVITNYLDVTYVSNITEIFKEKPLTGFKIHKILYNSKPHNNFKSQYGSTAPLIAPAEGLMWYNWLPKARHYVLPDDVPEQKRKMFTDTINAILNLNDKPFVIKNLAFAVRLKLIKEFFPEAKIIYITRDILYNAQSLFFAYKKNNVKQNQLWSIRPPNYETILNYPLPEKIINQMFIIQKEIEKNLPLFEGNYLQIKYEDFISNPKEFVEHLATFIGATYRKNTNLNNLKLKNGNKIRLNQNDLKSIQTAINKIYG